MKNFILNLKKSYGSRSFKAGSYSIFAGLIVVAIAVAINLIMSTLPVSITQRDLSNEKLFTISQQTRQIVAGLSEDVTIYWLVQPGSEDLTIEKLLDNYRDLSKHITVRHIDPVEQPNFAAKYTSEQIYNNTLIVDNGTRSKVLGYYDIFQYSANDYYSDSYEVSFAGESVLTSALDYVTNSELPVAYCLTGHGEAALPDSLVKEIKNENFILNKELSLLSLQALPEDCDLLIINAARPTYRQRIRTRL
jgi:ABC-2 type transport system permease protein